MQTAPLSVAAPTHWRDTSAPSPSLSAGPLLNGKESVVFSRTLVQVQDAGGNTIVNAKVGGVSGSASHNDLYIG